MERRRLDRLISLVALVFLSTLFVISAVASVGGQSDPARPCGRPLAAVRAQWRAADSGRGLDACRAKEAIWLEIRQCYAGYGEWLPDIRVVGDCLVEAQRADRARAFYRRVLERHRDRPCTHDGWTCGRAAAVELRLLACGFAWLSRDADAVWRDFAAAVLEPVRAAPGAFHLEPVVDDDELDGIPDLTCRAPPSARQSFAAETGFAVPQAVLRNGRRIADAVARSTMGARDRAIAVDLTDDEIAWTNRTGSGPARWLRMQVCPFPRPHIGPSGAMYFVELNLAASDERETAVCRSAWAWMGRRLP